MAIQKRIGLLAVAIAMCAAQAPVMAQTISKSVSYSDLNLSSVSGQNELKRRITAAARSVCGNLGSNGLAEFNAVQSCRKAAVEAAMRDAEIAIAQYQTNVRLSVTTPIAVHG